MKNLLKRISILNSKKEEDLEMEIGKFFPMSVIPPQEGDEPFSILVIVYDESDRGYFNLGYYDFEKKKWNVFGEEPMNLKCWCHAPNPSKHWTGKEYVSILCS